MQSPDQLLSLKNVRKTFPGVKALNGVSLDLKRGEVHALVGENGAGKSTLMKILVGVHTMDEGEIFINGQPVQIRSVHHARQLGISIIYQELSLIPQLTVAQNIFLNEEPQRIAGVLDERQTIRRTLSLLDEYQIGLNPNTPVSQLRIAERQLTEIIKAVSLGTNILVMDEPTSSLTFDEAENLFRIVNVLRDRGVGIIYISHRMDEIERLANRISILRDGQLVGTFQAGEISQQRVVSLMVGRELELADSKHRASSVKRDTTPALEVRGLSRKGILHDIALSIYPGEILGMAGLMGSGRSEIARALIGIDSIDKGEIRIYGEPAHIHNPAEALKMGIAMVPEDRHRFGLVMSHSVEDNLVLPLLPYKTRMGVLSRLRLREVANTSIKQMNIVPPNPAQLVKLLSGGNQQKVVLGKWLAGSPRILILDEPTMGVDVGAKAQIHDLIRSLANDGLAVLMISSDMPELIAMSHRIIVLCNGTICGEFLQNDVTQEKIMAQIMQYSRSAGIN